MAHDCSACPVADRPAAALLVITVHSTLISEVYCSSVITAYPGHSAGVPGTKLGAERERSTMQAALMRNSSRMAVGMAPMRRPRAVSMAPRPHMLAAPSFVGGEYIELTHCGFVANV